MKIKNIYYWLLIAAILTGCRGVTESGIASNTIQPESVTITADPADLVPAATESPITFVSAITGPVEIVTGTPTEIPPASPWSMNPYPLQIEVMRQQLYPGSPITIEQTLEPGANYSRYVVSYQSDGHKIFALMTIPNGTRPGSGWPVIVFNHGYIAPTEYRTTERYVAYVDMIARNGYIVFKSDYRGHGNSDGSEVIGGGYGTPGYTVDILNAVASLKMYQDADPDRIGMWGHSMGGEITLRAMVVSQDIKAGVIWGGVVVPYPTIIALWDYTRNPGLFPMMLASQVTNSSASNWLQNFSDWVNEFTTEYGNPEENPFFWYTISPYNYLNDLSGPIQIHHSTTDEMVPVAWSEILAEGLNVMGLPYEFYTYAGDNHNISDNFDLAMQRSINFFDLYVKGQ